MHQLDRSSVPAPECLSQYQHGRHNWEDVAHEHKAEVRAHLEQLQGRRCAYCEGSLDEFGHHIEHFRRRHVFPELTFAWENLYWSCCREDSCGRHKDSNAIKNSYRHDDLIAPCVDDPEVFFDFFEDGSVRPRRDLDDRRRWRATETIRVFNLDSWGGLRNRRANAVKQYRGTQPDMIADIQQIALEDPEFAAEWALQEIEKTKDEPFATTIKHFLRSLL